MGLPIHNSGRLASDLASEARELNTLDVNIRAYIPSAILRIGCILRRMSHRFSALILAVVMGGCGKHEAGPAVAIDPCENLRQLDPHCGWTSHWDHMQGRTNAIDGTKTEFLSLDSTDPDGTSGGRLSYADLRICLENGKLCGDKSVGVYVNVHGMVAPVSYETQHSTPVRIKFDDDKPARETWGIVDSNDALFPHGSQNQFLSQLIRHKKLILEFSYYQQVPRTLTFEISDLDDSLKSLGVDIKAQTAARDSAAKAQAAASEALERAMETSDRKRRNAAIEAFVGAHTEMGRIIASQIELCKNKNFPNDYCWEPADGSGPWGPFSTAAIATKYAMEHYKDHSK